MSMRIVTAAGLALGLVACTVAPMPTAHTPTDTKVPGLTPTHPTAALDAPPSLNRAAVNGGGEPIAPAECSVTRPCRLIGNVEVASGSGTLTGAYSPFGTFGVQTLTNIYDFSVFAHLSGTGRFQGIEPPAGIRLDVSTNVATVTVRLPASKGGWSLGTARTKPAFTLIPDLRCVLTEMRLETRLVVTLEHLGKTEIIDQHCTLEPSAN